MKRKLAFSKTISRLRGILCLFPAMFAVMACVTVVQEAHHDFPNSPTVKALAYISPIALWVRASGCTGVSAGASYSTIQSALNTCNSGGGGTVFMGDGGYTISGTITIPCNVTLSGTVHPYQQTHYQTAILTGTVTQPIHSTAGCSNPQNVSYIEWNGNQQNPGGGGINIVAGTNHFNVDHVYMHGANGPAINGCCSEVQVLLSGGGGTISNPTQNISITYSEFGPETAGADCGASMNETDTEASQGLCVGVLNDTFSINLSITNNIFQNLEEGAKVVEATTNGGSSLNSGNTQNLILNYNSFTNIQRIPFETQSNYYQPSFPTTQTIQYNFLGNRWTGGGGQQNFDLSIANGCGNPPSTNNCSANIDYNVDVQNLSSNHGAGNEVWGDSNTHANYWLMEGRVATAGGGFDWAQSGAFNFNNNIFNITSGGGTNCISQTGGYWNHEDAGVHTPTCTGNTYSNTGSGTYSSAAPTISPASGTFTTTQVVTFGLGSGAVNRDTNTSIYYTTDGSTPVPGLGTTKYIASGGTITVSATTVVKAVGMWGAINQPLSYPSGYGYVPSSAITNTYTLTSGGPALVSIAVTGTSSIPAGGTDQLTATGTYSDSSTANLTSVAAWVSSATGKATVNTSGLATGISAGAANITATSNAITSPNFSLTVTGGTSNIVFFSSATGVGTIGSSSGLFVAVGSGTTNVTGSIGSVVSNVLVMTVAGSQPTVLKNVTISGLVVVH